MDLFRQLPYDIQMKMFYFFEHPTAKIIKVYYRSKKTRALREDICHFPTSLKKLYKLPFAKNHDGRWGRATLLNSLWTEARLLCGTYYKIWERMFRVKSPRTAQRWIRCRYAVNCHKFQINSLWALFTKEERNQYLMRYKLLN